MNSTIAGCTLFFKEHQSFITWMACRALGIELNGYKTGTLGRKSEVADLLALRLDIHPRTATKWVGWATEAKWLSHNPSDDTICVPGETDVTKKFISQVKRARVEMEVHDWLPGMPMLGNPVRMDVSFHEMCDPHLPGKTRAELHDFASVFTSLMAWSRHTLANFVDKHIITSRRYHNRTNTFREAQFLGINVGSPESVQSLMQADADVRAASPFVQFKTLQTQQTKAHTFVGHEVPSKYHSKYSVAKQSAHFARRLKITKPEHPGMLPNATANRISRLQKHMSAIASAGTSLLSQFFSHTSPILVTPTFLGYGTQEARTAYLFGGSG